MPAKLLSLVLAFWLMLCVGSAQAAGHTFSGLFSLEYDERAYTLDTTTWLEHSADASRWLFMLSADDYVIDASMSRVEGWEHVSLTDPNGAMTSWYLENMLTNGVEHIGNVVSDGALFCLFRSSDADGEYLLAETLANGWAVSIYAYYDDPEQKTDDALKAALTGLLNTYKPQR